MTIRWCCEHCDTKSDVDPQAIRYICRHCDRIARGPQTLVQERIHECARVHVDSWLATYAPSMLDRVVGRDDDTPPSAA